MKLELRKHFLMIGLTIAILIFSSNSENAIESNQSDPQEKELFANVSLDPSKDGTFQVSELQNILDKIKEKWSKINIEKNKKADFRSMNFHEDSNDKSSSEIFSSKPSQLGDLTNPIIKLLKGTNFEEAKEPEFVAHLEDQTRSLEKDYEKILEGFRKIGCFDKFKLEDNIRVVSNSSSTKENTQKDLNPYSICESDLADQLFKPLTQVKIPDADVFKHFDTQVYRPLSYKVFKNRFSFNDALQDLLSLDPDNLMIKKDLPIPTFEIFKKIILGGFTQIAQYSVDFEDNKSIISSIILDILKQFHIYWNVKRQRNQIDSTKIGTYSILKSIIKEYQQINGSMKAITIHFLNLIKNSYFTFFKAHMTFKVMLNNALKLFAMQIVRRYENNILKILDGTRPKNFIFFELSIFMDMYRGFMLVAASSKYKPHEINSMFSDLVISQIIQKFEEYQKNLLESNSPLYDSVTDFTASLILKFKHREGMLVNKANGIGYGNQEAFLFDNGKTNHIKFFYELMDLLMLTPNMCVDYTRLSACVLGIGLQAVSRLRTKYGLNFSTVGYSLCRYFESCIWQVHDLIFYRLGFTNFNFFRNLFYAELFKVNEQYKTMYCINDMSAVNKLQEKIGEQIQLLKTKPHVTLSLVREANDFDNKLYDFFLDIKGDYNGYVHIERNPSIISEIKDKLFTFINENCFEYPKETDILDKEQTQFRDKLIEIVNYWSEPYLDEYSHDIESQFADSAASVIEPLPDANSVTIANILSEPQIDTGANIPLFIEKPKI